MKKTLKLFGLLSLVVVMLVSCKDDDPKDNNLFIGTYKGKVTYLEKVGADKISNEDGSVFVSKLGNKYTFKFSDDIPSLKNIEMPKGENKLDLKWGEGNFITIDAHSLKMLVIKDGSTWTANCER